MTQKNKRLDQVLAWLAFASIAVALYLVFVNAPLEKTMREVQKIFYFHVASAWIGMFSFLVVFICSIIYLSTRDSKWDIFAYTSAEIGVIFTTIVLVTGPIWARPIWNTWWTWDPRLTTTLIMWFLYLAYGRIRSSLGEEEKRARFAAVFGIISFVDVPIVFFAARWWNSMHPVVISGTQVGLAPAMKPAFFFSLAAFTVLYLYMWRTSIKTELLKAEIKTIKDNVLG
jgi:heme exporter protein C